MQYDAIEQPDPEIWLELDEAERVDLVIDYHRRIGVQLENPELHAVAHVVVENQVALGEATPAPETLERLMDEGLDRHEAVHAIGSILMEIVFDAAHKPDDGGDINANYYRGLALLTAADWRMKAAAANDASTHPLNEAEAIRLNRKLWGNPAAASVLEAEFNGVESKKKKSPKKRSATEVADRCIETVRATIENAITGLLRAHAPRAKFELLFEALGEILVDVQRQILEADDEARRRVCRRDQDSGSRSWR